MKERNGKTVSSSAANEQSLGDCACLLCGSLETTATERMTGLHLRRLWNELEQEFFQESWGRIGEEFDVVLFRCERCGFEFFDPSLDGNELFYQQLEHPEYYSPIRPEFTRALALAHRTRLKRILDVGCGSGAFLDMARGAGHEVFGLELNTAAANKARFRNHRVFEKLLHELDDAVTGGGFDLITFFQVLEHVSDPVKVMKDAAARLNSGGYIAVAVPSSQGVLRLAPLDPHQWPPHHISRWRQADLSTLAKAARLQLVEFGGDPLLGADLKHYWLLQDRLAVCLDRKRYPGIAIASKLISLFYRKSGMKMFFTKQGRSIYGHFQHL
jgi:SAM-dependent methyltransferase